MHSDDIVKEESSQGTELAAEASIEYEELADPAKDEVHQHTFSPHLTNNMDPPIDYQPLSTPTDPTGNPLRRGKWTVEESTYANRLIHEFRRGTLPLPPHTNITLREFLSKLLRCDPMRITKKFEGDNCLRKVVYKSSGEGGDAVVREEIRELESKFLARLEKTKTTSSQAVPDRALLDGLRAIGEGKDLIDLFCESMEGNNGTEEGPLVPINVQESQLRSLKRQHHPETFDSNVSFQQALMIQLQRMQQLIQGQQQRMGIVSSQADVASGIDQAELELFPSMKKLKVEFNYNAAVANMLSVQRMLLDSKHKLFDLEFNFCDVQSSRDDGSHDQGAIEKRKEAIEAMKKEIDRLEMQQAEIANEIAEKYKRSGNQ
jgi:hypothetical protein